MERNRNTPMVRAIESGETWKEREGNLLEGMDRRIRRLEIAQQFARSLDSSAPIEEIQRQCQDRISAEVKQLSSAVKRKLSRMIKLNVEIETTKKLMVDLGGQDFDDAGEWDLDALSETPDGNSKELAKQDTILFRKEQALSAFMFDPDVSVHNALEQTYRSFGEKFAQVRAFEKDPALLLLELNKRIQAGAQSTDSENDGASQRVVPLTQADVVNMDFDALNAYVVVEQAKMPGARGHSLEGKTRLNGLHYRGTPINLISSLAGPGTKTHEAIHNLLDSAKLETRGPVSVTAGKFRRAYRMMEQNTPLSIMQSEWTGSAYLLDSCHEEILAAFENAESDPRTLLLRELSLLRSGVKGAADFYSTAQVYATAGKDSLDFYEKLTTLAGQSTSFEGVSEGILAFRDNYAQSFVRMAKEIHDVCAIADRIGAEAVSLAHLALVILPPSRYRHAEKLLSHRFGEDRIAKEKLFLHIANAYTGSLVDLQSRVDALSPDAPQFAEQAAALARVVAETNISGMLCEDTGVETIGKARSYVATLERLAGLTAGVDFRHTREAVLFQFFDHLLDRLVMGKITLDEHEYAGLVPEERAALLRAVDAHIDSGYWIDDLTDRLGHKATLKDLEESDFWKLVTLAGAQNEASESVKNYIDRGSN